MYRIPVNRYRISINTIKRDSLWCRVERLWNFYKQVLMQLVSVYDWRTSMVSVKKKANSCLGEPTPPAGFREHVTHMYPKRSGRNRSGTGKRVNDRKQNKREQLLWKMADNGRVMDFWILRFRFFQTGQQCRPDSYRDGTFNNRAWTRRKIDVFFISSCIHRRSPWTGVVSMVPSNRSQLRLG